MPVAFLSLPSSRQLPWTSQQVCLDGAPVWQDSQPRSLSLCLRDLLNVNMDLSSPLIIFRLEEGRFPLNCLSKS